MGVLVGGDILFVLPVVGSMGKGVIFAVYIFPLLYDYRYLCNS